MGTATGMSEDDGVRRRQGSPRTPGDCGKPLFPEVAGDAPTAGTHSSRRQDHAPRAECDRPGPKQCTGSREARPWRVGTFKSPGGRGLCAPPPAPRPAPCAAPRGFPEPLCGAGGVGQEGGRRGRQRQARGLRTGRQKAGIPPLPAASRPLGNFPRLGTSPAGLTPLRRRDPAVSRRSEELEKETSWRCGEAGTVPSGNSPCRPATAYPSQRGRPFS